MVQVCILLEYSLPILSQQFYIWVLPRITPIIVPFIHISLTGSVYSVVAVAIERFLTVCFPFQQCQVTLKYLAVENCNLNNCFVLFLSYFADV